MTRCETGANLKTKNFKQYQVVDMTLENWARDVSETMETDMTGPKWFTCINPHSYVLAKTDLKFQRALRHANWILPDGIGIILGSKWIGQNIQNRITGLDAFYSIMQEASRKEKRVFFMGGSEECIRRILVKVKLDFPGVSAVDGISPPYCDVFDEKTNSAMISHINEFQPDIIWIGLTAPKQEKWIFDNLSNLPNAIVGPIGAVFDYYAGTTKLAPIFVRKMGLEWLYRLIGEPKRVWRRTLKSAPLFILDILTSK